MVGLLVEQDVQIVNGDATMHNVNAKPCCLNPVGHGLSPANAVVRKDAPSNHPISAYL